MKKTTKKPDKKLFFINSRYIYHIAIFFLVIVFMGGLILYRIIASQTKPTIETHRSEMSKIPPDIKKRLSSQTNVSKNIRVPILMYHYVEYVQDRKDTIRQSLNINPDIFEQQIKTLVDAGYTFMTAKELGNVLDGKTELPDNPILLTFDDGHWDLDTAVLPILKKYKVKATAYIISGFIGNSDFLTQSQLQDVINSKLIEIGAHTVHHVSLKGKLFPIVKTEVEKSKEALEKNYHLSVVSFAYPNGAFDQQAADIVKKAGFTTSVSTIPGINQNLENRFFLYRLRPGRRTGQQLLEYLKGTAFRPW